MVIEKPIKWTTIIEDTKNNVYICYIEDFSNELKDRIRVMLSNIWNGAVDSVEDSDIYNYKMTLIDFLERYSSKSPNLKKWIIGELLSHLLIPQYLKEFEVISIMKNKEEKSIRKWFDSVYYNNLRKNIWYCEVKSWGDQDNLSVNEKNRERLSQAKSNKTGVAYHSLGKNQILWQSVLTDVKSTIFDKNKQIDIKKLLKADYPNIQDRNLDRNVILSSVIYKNLSTRICHDNLKSYKISIDSEKIFTNLIIFSIQKETYSKIEEFLIEETNNKNDW